MKKNMLDRLIRRHSTTQPNVSGVVFCKDVSQRSTTFKIGWDHYFGFMTEYCEALYAQPNVFASYQLYEYNKEESSLRFTLIFNFVKENTSISDKEIELILPIIRESIFNTLQLESKEAIACVCVGKEDSRCVLDYTFPTIRINKEHFNKVVKKNFCDRLVKLDIRRVFPQFKGGDWEDIILPMNDFSPMYGCKISKDDPSVSFVGLWSSTDDKIGDDIHESFTARKNALFQTHCKKELENIDEDKCDYIPVILSSRFYPGITMPKIEESISKRSFDSDISSSEESDMIYHLLPLISKERLDNSMYRWQIGRCIYNIFKKEKNGLDIFNTFCRQNIEENALWWRQYKNDQGVNDFLSIRTIGHFARLDDPNGYDEWHKSWMHESVEQSLVEKTELNIAEVMYRLLWLDFMTVNKADWYYFDPEDTKLTKCVSNVDFKSSFMHMIRYYAKYQMENAGRLAAVEMADISKTSQDSTKRSKIITSIIQDLGKKSYENAIEALCFTKFYRKKVEKYFDTNRNLIAWNNCITEIHGTKIYCRPGKMEDFVTMNSVIDYDEDEFSWDHPEVKEVLYWHKTAFIGKGLVDYFHKICASLLLGRNKEKAVYAFCGPSGNNSKTMIQSILDKIFSIYCVNLPVSVLTDNKQNSNNASPEVAQAKGARVAFIAEPDGKIPLMASLIKRYSGDDKIFARKLHDNGDSFDVMFKMIICCNAVPPIEGLEDASENRMVILPFLTQYCDNAPDTEEERFKQKKFPIDTDFKDKLEYYRRPMLWIIINSYEKYATEGLRPEDRPEAVKEYTAKYWEKNDPYRLFIGENLEKTDNKGDKVKVSDVYTAFDRWWKFYVSKKIEPPDIVQMTKRLSSDKFMGEPNNRIWSGWRFKESDGMKDRKSIVSGIGSKDKPKHNID